MIEERFLPLFFLHVITLLIVTSILSGCSSFRRLADVGEAPPLTRVQNPVANKNYRPIEMPMPRPRGENIQEGTNSLWQAGAKGFFKDQRANNVGDILTVIINISDSAAITNETTRNRTTSDKVAVNNFMGFEQELTGVLPEGVKPENLVGVTSNPTHKGTGKINRSETLSLKVAGTITQILPNGNFVIQGRQEIRVNFEVRELMITGIVRAEDILSDNTISYEKIAEARISYGGRGQQTDVQQPPYGHQIVDIIMPF